MACESMGFLVCWIYDFWGSSSCLMDLHLRLLVSTHRYFLSNFMDHPLKEKKQPKRFAGYFFKY